MSSQPEGPKELVVFSVKRPTKCGQCGDDLHPHSFIALVDNSARCLECADLDHLWFLPTGNAALTRRARKHSRVSPVVVEWSRARKRYERQGVLVEPEAVERAEEECLADADLRAARAERARERLEVLDEEFVRALRARILALYPSCPGDQATTIAEYACVRGSGRVGRSKAARELGEDAVRLAVVASIRHRHTPYDELLMRGYDRDAARAEVAAAASGIEAAWREAPPLQAAPASSSLGNSAP